MKIDSKNFLTIFKMSEKFIFFIIVFFLLWLSSRYNYLLFHSISEFFSIVISSTIFIIAWNSKDKSDNPHLIHLGIAYLFIGIIDLFHTLSFSGMNIFPENVDFATRLWIAARYFESIALLLFIFAYRTKKAINYYLFFIILFFITTIILLSIFIWKIFPVCFIEGMYLTPFKIISEYIISAILSVSLVFLFLKKKEFDEQVFKFLVLSIIFTILSEIAFTFYIRAYDISNLVSHYLKILSFYFIYKSIVETGIKVPYNIVFKQLKENEAHLKELNATKDKFFSIIAHDLRNPITSLLGFLKLLVDDFSELSKEKILKYLKTMEKSTKSEYRLLENLLLWARSQTNSIKYNPKKFEISRVINSCIELYASTAEAKNIILSFEAGKKEMVFADKDMIEFVIRNLISNALKFTEDGGNVNITSSINRKKLIIAVIDTGVGIKNSNLYKLFRIGYNISTRGTKRESGSGLGLILCKEFVEMNKGKIWMESELKKGIKVFFSLPLK